MLVLEYSEEEAKGLFMMLKKDPILKNISLSELFELLELSTMVQYDPGEYIIKQGEYDTQLFILISGNMEIIHNDKTIRILEKTGEIVGEMSLISKDVRSASVKAVNQVKCLSIDASYMDSDKTDPRSILYYIFCHVLVRRLKGVNQQLSKLKEALTC